MGRALHLLLLLTALLWAAPTMAQPEADKTTARQLYHDGTVAFDSGRFAEAADLFRRSNELYSAPTSALGLARSLRDGRQLVEAYEVYAAIVLAGPGDAPSAAFVTAVESAAAEQAALEPRLAALVIDVVCTCEPTVELDGTNVPRAALGVKRFVNPGTRGIAVRADGWKPEKRFVTLREGQVESVRIELSKLQPATSPKPPPVAPEEPVQLPPVAPPPPPSGGMRVAGMVLGGVGLAALVVAGITGALYLSKKSEVEDKCPDRICTVQEDVDTATEGHRMGLVNTITLPLGAAALGTGVLLFVLAPDETEAGVSFVPTVGGFTVRGTF